MARFTLPRDIYHGKGSLAELKNLKGKKAVLVVGGGSMKRQGFLDKAVNYLKEGGNGNALKIFWPFSGSSKDDRLTNDWSVWKTFLICAVMFAIGYYVTYTGFSTTAANPNATETEMELYFTFCSPNVLLMTLAIFLMLQKVVINTPVIVKALANMTQCGFGIYMVHYFVVGPFFLLIGPSEIPIPLQVPLMAVCIFLCSWAFTALLYKLMPHKAKYIMG